MKIWRTIFAYGGVDPETSHCAEIELVSMVPKMCEALKIEGLTIEHAYGDADVGRARTKSAQNFLKSDADVWMMIDHDIIWRPGDMLHLCAKAHELQAIVGGLVSKRSKHGGIASKLEADLPANWIGEDHVIRADWVGGAFTAIPRSIVQAVNDLPEVVCAGGPNPFMQFRDEITKIYMSEDWAFCVRAAQRCNAKIFVSTLPVCGHKGETKTFWVDGEDPTPRLGEGGLKISCIHATRGNPERARRAIDTWLSRKSGLNDVEYIVSLDEDDEISTSAQWPDTVKVVSGNGHPGSVGAYNRGIYSISDNSQIIVQVMDDCEPPPLWDALISQRMGDTKYPWLLHVSDGTDNKGATPGLLTVLIGTAAYFKKCGYMYHPSYTHLFGDDDHTRKGHKEGIVMEATDITFRHCWAGPQGAAKEWYSDAQWAAGRAALEAREKDGFRDQPELWGRL